LVLKFGVKFFSIELMSKWALIVLAVVLIVGAGVGFWWWRKTCFVSVVDDSSLVKIARVDKKKLSLFVQQFVPCKAGYFELIENPNSQVKVKVKQIKVRFADEFIGVRVGQDRNKPDYSFWWEKGGRRRLDLTTWVNPKWNVAADGNWEKNLVVGLSYLKNSMGENSLSEAKEAFNLLSGKELGVVLQKADE